MCSVGCSLVSLLIMPSSAWHCFGYLECAQCSTKPPHPLLPTPSLKSLPGIFCILDAMRVVYVGTRQLSSQLSLKEERIILLCH